MKLGILYPRSAAHPGITQDFMDGIKTVLQQQGLDGQVQILSESIGYGGAEKEVYEKAEKLLVLEGADTLVAYVDLKALEILKPLIYSSNKLVIVVNPGANFPQNWMGQPNMIHLTLQQAFLCWLTGKQAAGRGGHGVMATTFYDCGYLHTAAMVRSFTDGGGTIRFNYINKQRYDEGFEISQLTDYLEANQDSDVLLCAFDTLPASLFYPLLNGLHDAERLHVFASPMMLEPKALEKARGLRFSIEGYLPWLASSADAISLEFISYYSEQTKKQPTIFSLLGWEAGLIIGELMKAHTGSYGDGAVLAGELLSKIIKTPRGEIRLDPGTHYFIAPACKVFLEAGSSDLHVEEIKDIEKEWTEFTSNVFEGLVSGWTNTYLCY